MISVEYTITDLNQRIYNFAFDYLKKKYVKVSSKNITTGVVTNYTYGVHYVVVDKTVELLHTVGAVGDVLRIVRETSTSEQIVSWNDASILKASDMSLAQLQQLHVLEEYSEYMSTSSLSLDINGQYDAKNSRIVNLASPQTAKDAVNRGYIDSFIGTLTDAQTSATLAQSWAIGDILNRPEGSSKYWAEQAKNHIDDYYGFNTNVLVESTGYGVISGLNVTANTSDMNVQINAGIVHMPNGKRFVTSSTTISVLNSDTTYPRIDCIYIDIEGKIKYLPGNPTNAPTSANIPSDCIKIAEIYVSAGVSNITSINISDERIIKKQLSNIMGYTNITNPTNLVPAKGDNITDNTKSLLNIINSFGSNNGVLVIPPGTFLVGNLVIPYNITLKFMGGILKVKSGCVLDIYGAIEASDDIQIFDFVDIPTNTVGSPQPIKLSGTNGMNRKCSRVSIRWFGAVGDCKMWTTLDEVQGKDNTYAINAAFTALADGGTFGSLSNSANGACTIYVPRGRYRVTGTLRMPAGCRLLGDGGTSSSLSSIYRNDANSNSMLIAQGSNVGGSLRTHYSQHYFENIKFEFHSRQGYGTTPYVQQDTATIDFQDPNGNIDTLFHNCWFLSSPMRGSHIRVANKVLGANPDEGLLVTLRIFNTIFDGCNGQIFRVDGNARLQAHAYNCCFTTAKHGLTYITTTARDLDSVLIELYACELHGMLMREYSLSHLYNNIPVGTSLIITGGYMTGYYEPGESLRYGNAFQLTGGNIIIRNVRVKNFYSSLVWRQGEAGGTCEVTNSIIDNSREEGPFGDCALRFSINYLDRCIIKDNTFMLGGTANKRAIGFYDGSYAKICTIEGNILINQTTTLGIVYQTPYTGMQIIKDNIGTNTTNEINI